MYSSSFFLFVPLGRLEAESELLIVVVIIFLVLVALAEADGPSTKKVLLMENDSFHDAILFAKDASSVIVFYTVDSTEQVHRGYTIYKQNCTVIHVLKCSVNDCCIVYVTKLCLTGFDPNEVFIRHWMQQLVELLI